MEDRRDEHKSLCEIIPIPIDSLFQEAGYRLNDKRQIPNDKSLNQEAVFKGLLRELIEPIIGGNENIGFGQEAGGQLDAVQCFDSVGFMDDLYCCLDEFAGPGNLTEGQKIIVHSPSDLFSFDLVYGSLLDIFFERRMHFQPRDR